jgi:ParB-like chromosome segregation protein Spo0J
MAAPKISIHPAAAIFPMMSDAELAEMADSIKKHGLREKIHAIPHVVDDATDWEVLDGRNRLECLRRYLKKSDTDIIADYMLPVKIEQFGATAEEYVMMANIERRNLTQAQRRDLAGKLVLMLQAAQAEKPKAEKVDATAVAAEKAGVSRRTAATAAQEAKTAVQKPEKQNASKTKTAAEKAAATESAHHRPALVLAKIDSITNSTKDVKLLAVWDDVQIEEAQKKVSVIAELLKLDIERRSVEAIAKAKQILAEAEAATTATSA